MSSNQLFYLHKTPDTARDVLDNRKARKIYFTLPKILHLSTLIFSLALNILFANPAEAKDHYLGVYEDGREAYVMTETVKYYEEHRHGYLVAQGYNCTVKAVYPHSDNVEYISYKYMYGPQTDGLHKNGTFYGFRSEYLKRLKKMPNHPETRLMNYLISLCCIFYKRI